MSIHVSFHTHGPVALDAKNLSCGSVSLAVDCPNEGVVALYFDSVKQFDEFCRAVEMENRKIHGDEEHTWFLAQEQKELEA